MSVEVERKLSLLRIKPILKVFILGNLSEGSHANTQSYVCTNATLVPIKWTSVK